MTRRECDVAIVGAGLVGSLLGIFLQQQGKQVHIYEKRSDMRVGETGGGRSINLVATSRGIHALEQVGLRDEILAITTPVYGRMMHDRQGNLKYQSYSKDNTDCNYSVPRAQLNKELMTYAEKAGAKILFSHELQGADFDNGVLSFAQGEVQAERIYGTDGAGSAVRRLLVKQGHISERVEFLPDGYKELVIPATPQGEYAMDKDALHIWPRGEHMLMALPNQDGSFTVTLYLANEGDVSFAALDTPERITTYFETYYPDSVPLMPNLVADFFDNPTGLLGTVWSGPWHYKDKVALLGDSAHGIVPFFGQGMNAGFEDCSALMELMKLHGDDFDALFAAYHQTQKPNGDAIARMALANYVEMRDHVGDAHFLLQKQVEALLGRTYPELYLSKYSMVTHSLIPYAVAEKAGAIQRELLSELCEGLSGVEDVNLKRAKELLELKLSPFLQQHGVSLQA